jgi:Putative beta-barrel porin-2, OmpL-like. bbp2
MRRHGKISLGLAMLLGSPLAAFAQAPAAAPAPATPAPAVVAPATPAPAVTQPAPTYVETGMAAAPAAAPAGPCCGTGPTPLTGVNIINDALGLTKESCIHISAWMDFDYTYSNNGSGPQKVRVAPVMNSFGNEFLTRSLGVYLHKDLDQNCFSWGFNVIAIAGADASFLEPTAGGWNNTDPRFGTSFTDLNVTFHLPILTDGGVDVKVGRQTTCLGPMGALPWQRYFDSSDYAWYNMEEGRYTGVSTVWHVSKRLDLYNGIEVGGWGAFFDNTTQPGYDYLGQISYWLDEECKNTKTWVTLLTGPTSRLPGLTGENTTTFEFGFSHNFWDCWYMTFDTQIVYSKAPLGAPGSFNPNIPNGYQERAYDAYTYVGRHITDTLDLNFRAEWYRDEDGGGYAGGFGVPKTTYYEFTFGPDYHPTKWLQIRPEIRYDTANNPNFGPNNDKKDQLSLAIEALFKF